ncbi:L,D-transpeptidase [Paenibacillus wulumuqiensis]|uniref:L,D-transpeptidase n=1 Tax=Paenibacillus wulumuqiensis TaxID=1567107 RepID=UPI0006198DBA|nr:L,D-transpeptidase [Paenibacillus wulumuqiensis]
MKNLLYLKRYVKMHPNNRMGWYLLGKEYEAEGQVGKANYCYNRAGDIYEAFEHSKVPADVLKDYEAKVMEMAHKREQKIRRWRYSMLGVVLLFLFMMRSVAAPYDSSQLMAQNDPAAPVQTKTGKDTGNSEPEKPPFRAPLAFTAVGLSFGSDEAADSFTDYMQQQALETAPNTAVVLGMEKSDKWLLWKPKLPVMYTLAEGDNPGQTRIQSYDAENCHCKPGQLRYYQKEAGEWMQQQEELAAMQTAIHHYRTAKGKLPAQPGQLESAFPGNWLSGSTEVMNQTFTALKALQSGSELPASAAAGSDSEAAQIMASTLGSQPYFQQPLEIIVDKKKHRLAVASGQVLLRNYEVGLGGAKTPEGTFNISIKVMDPNGKSNGDFGSRGMQLSDTNYAIHGTNEPDSIGLDDSLGCVRMDQEDVEELFDMVPLGTKVTIASDVLPGKVWVPEKRFKTSKSQNQTDPHTTYHWLD